jgi:hypothetical protein
MKEDCIYKVLHIIVIVLSAFIEVGKSVKKEIWKESRTVLLICWS